MYRNVIRLFAAIAVIAIATTSLTACVDEDDYPNTPEGNFEALWHIIDEHYCFFDYKQKQYGLDWNEVYRRYRPQFDASMNTEQKFEVLANMVGELRDGHVNIYAPFDVARNWSWQEDYPSNLSDTLIRSYMGTDYRIAAGMQYRILDDQMGFVRCSSFGYELGEGNLDEILYYLAPCRGLIIDIRGNGGGDLTNAEKMAARFCNEKTLVGYRQHKRGTGHSDFSPMEPRYLEP